MPDQNCLDSNRNFSNGYEEVIGVTPNNAQSFITRYRQDNDYRNYIDARWGERAYFGAAPDVVDNRTRDGIVEGWGRKCTGQRQKRINSRHNAKNRGINCCSKFRNGEMAFSLDDNRQGQEDCGWGWTGRPVNIDPDEYKLTVDHPPPAWMEDFEVI